MQEVGHVGYGGGQQYAKALLMALDFAMRVLMCAIVILQAAVI